MAKPTAGMIVVLLGSHLQETHCGHREVQLGAYDPIDVFRAERAGLLAWNSRLTQAGRTALKSAGMLDG